MSTHRHRLTFEYAALVLLGLTACDTTVQAGLTEPQADEVIVALYQQQIGASKSKTTAGAGSSSFSVDVAASDTGAALAVLRANDLPRAPNAGLREVFSEGGLVPTTIEERARYSAAVAGELASTIESMGSVIDARVHLALPDAHAAFLDDAPIPPRASVLIKRVRDTPPIEASAVQQLVAGAVQGLDANRVAVVQVAGGAKRPTHTLTRVGPFSVSPSSATPLQILLVALTIGFFLIGAWLGYLFRGLRGAR